MQIHNIEHVLKVGNVISVNGRSVNVLVDYAKNTPNLLFNGQIIKGVSVGGYLKIIKGFEILIGKIDEEFVSEENSYGQSDYTNAKNKIRRILKISLIGFYEINKFKQGIKILPLIDNECFLLTDKEFDDIHYFIREINGVKDEELHIGHLSVESGVDIKFGVNSLLASHIGIFGNTGSGKSYTLASIYHQLFNKYSQNSKFDSNAKFLIFDFNGEYSGPDSITSNKKVFKLSTKRLLEEINDLDKLPFSQEVLLDSEIISIISSATEKTQKPFINRSLSFLREVFSKDNPREYFKNILKNRIKDVLLMADKEKSFMLIDYISWVVNDSNSSSDKGNALDSIEWNNKFSHFMPRGGNSRELKISEVENNYLYTKASTYIFPKDILSKIVHFLYLQLIHDVFYDKAKNDHIGPAINKLKSKVSSLEKVIDTGDNTDSIFSDSNVVVINLNDVNTETKKLIPLLVSKTIYANQKRDFVKSQDKFLNIIIDEAHNILSYSSDRESETWKDYRLETFEEMIKEGRKFGVFLTIASQRPSDISSTIISQLHNFFLHRLINNRDIDAVEKTISYLDKVSFESLPILPTGTCVFAGLSAQMPLMLDIKSIEPKYEPQNKTIKPTDYWH